MTMTTLSIYKLFTSITILSIVIANENSTNEISDELKSDLIEDTEDGKEENADNVFNGVYTECFLHLSYSCLQKKTLLYLKELNKLSEVSVIGEYVKFVKVNDSETDERNEEVFHATKNSEELSFLIDIAVDKFFNNHIIKFNALGKDIPMPRTVEEFVGRKRKGGGGGHGGGHGGHGGEDGGKKKMMMMAMMCMKMKLMMMVPAMMGMMGMMSFKGMMFSMMSFMISKMMLLMKLLEKKGGGGGIGAGGGGDGGWAAGGGGGGGAWMPAGGQDFAGGGGGGYDANGQWQSRSILDEPPEHTELFLYEHKPILSYVAPTVRHNNNANRRKTYSTIKKLNDEIIKINQERDKPKSRKKRGVLDIIQNAYLYWMNQMLGVRNNMKYNPKYPKYRVINGIKYVYYPIRYIQKGKSPKELQISDQIKVTDVADEASDNIKITNHDEGFKPIITADDFNKGEIVEGPVERKMHRNKIKNMNKDVNEALDENPWQ